MEKVLNYINNQWQALPEAETRPVHNPATGEILAQTPLTPPAEVSLAVQAAAAALPAWRDTPPEERIQPLFRLKALVEASLEDLARIITLECGKTLPESRGEIQRAIENIEVACGIPTLMQGVFSEDIAPGIDEIMIRQPVGVCTIIAPFNFPAMIPFWFFPYALACGNTVIVKPSERVPLTMQAIFRLVEQVNLPPGVLNLVNGARPAVDALLDDPAVRAVSFVGSTSVAKYIYARAAANGKRAQCQGGAKNPVVLLPDADPEMTLQIIADSAFGCAGQRCLAASILIPVGDASRKFLPMLEEAARSRVVGNGLVEGVQMGPVISPESLARIEGLIETGLAEGARMLVEGRDIHVPGGEGGNFIAPTVLLDVPPLGELARTEVFGPLLSVIPAPTLEDAIAMINQAAYGNMACIFTASGAAARKFRHDVQAGNVGVNIGVAAPMAYFPFSGWKESFFGDLHAQSHDAVDFFTQKKVVIERWPRQWSRRF